MFYTPAAIAEGLPLKALKLAAKHGRYEQEGVRLRKDGSSFWAHVVIVAVHDETGRLTGFVKVTRDNSHRKQTESNLRLLAERLSLATSVAGVGVWDWELATDALTWDATMFAIYGVEQRDRINYHDWSVLVHPNDLSEVKSTFRRVIEKKGDGSLEFRIVLVDGTVRYVSAVARVVLDSNANAVRVIGVNVDITERKAAEVALRKSEERMKYLAEHDFLTG